jgi:hypothetical protein
MLKVVITERGQAELSFLNFDVEKMIEQIIKKIPKGDLKGISHIYVTDLPKKNDSRSKRTNGAYFQKLEATPAYIEIYLKNLFKHIHNPESMNLMLPIQSQGLANTIFHEVGHHVKHIRSHGIKKSRNESFAGSYAKPLLNGYIRDNAAAINACFDNLDKVADEKGLSKEIINNMRDGWEKQYQTAVKMSE